MNWKVQFRNSTRWIKEWKRKTVQVIYPLNLKFKHRRHIWLKFSFLPFNRFQIRHVPSLHDCHRKCGGSNLRPTAGLNRPVTVGRQSDRPAGQNHKHRSGEFVLLWFGPDTHFFFFFSKTTTEFKTFQCGLVSKRLSWDLDTCVWKIWVGMFLSNFECGGGISVSISFVRLVRCSLVFR